MHLGVSRIHLHLPENHDLKGKRQVIRPLVDKVRNRFNVAIAEVEDQDIWQSAVLGVAAVGNDAAHVNEMLAQVVAFIERSALDAVLVDYDIELMTV